MAAQTCLPEEPPAVDAGTRDPAQVSRSCADQGAGGCSLTRSVPIRVGSRRPVMTSEQSG